jgi:hypothetical protein
VRYKRIDIKCTKDRENLERDGGTETGVIDSWDTRIVIGDPKKELYSVGPWLNFDCSSADK